MVLLVLVCCVGVRFRSCGLDRRRAVRFVDLSGQEAGDCLKDRSKLLQRFHVIEDGRMLSGALQRLRRCGAIPVLRP